ncbi:MAG: hypothetical protein H6861_03975 [Rhodospirillales bacterium]|nr:hypothetical protein [Rhodospirillales bacterium]
MRFLFLTLLILIPLNANAACGGYNNAMGALEAAIADTRRPVLQPPLKYRDRNDGPPLSAINAAIDDLEAAIEKHNVRKIPVPSQSYPHHQKPRL